MSTSLPDKNQEQSVHVSNDMLQDGTPRCVVVAGRDNEVP